MATKYFQIGSSIGQNTYSGEDSSGAVVSGIAKTLAITPIVSGDTVEIPIIEVPAGAKIGGISLQTDALIAASGWSCAFSARKKSNSIFSGTTSSTSGTASGSPDFTLAGGALNGSAGVGALVGGTVNPVITAPVNLWNSVFPQGIEGNTTVNGITAARQALQDTYYFGLLFTSSGVVAFPANVNIFMTIDYEFVGTL